MCEHLRREGGKGGGRGKSEREIEAGMVVRRQRRSSISTQYVQGTIFQPGECHADADQNLPQNARDGEGVEKVMNDLDANSDGEVDFTEFIILMGALTVACNDFFMEYKPEKLIHKPFEKKEATTEEMKE
ncbi:unnamed protein product [Coregonus sp. 'balchen']|nr:unnamed protein product [Coregonus sp. 'balchen']